MSTKKWNWKKQRERHCFLALADGAIFRGYSIGANVDRVGEVVFNTGMTGYQEILSDPSYSGQFVTMTYPEIGNTGINHIDQESRAAFAGGFIIHELNENENWRSEESLDDYLKRFNIPAIAGIDTRAVTIRIRKLGALKGFLSMTGNLNPDQALKQITEWPGLDGQDYAAKVTCDAPYDWCDVSDDEDYWGLVDKLPPADLDIVAYDFGIKWNILRRMRINGMNVSVVPAKTPAADILKRKPDGVFFSNGPADPAAVTYAIEAGKQLIGKVPVMGICLGHQLLGLACGGETYRLKFGHHGCNHPVKNLDTGEIEITSQNHNFAIAPATISSSDVEVTHINLNDETIEGIRHRREPMFAIQYHPEAGPGPHDPQYLFKQFRSMIESA